MAFSRLLASWLLLVKMRRSPLQPLVPHQGDSSPRPHWAFCPISVSSNPASIDLIASLPRLPGDVPTMMSLPTSHGGTYMLLSLSLCQEHLRGHILCDLYIRPVAWLWFSVVERKLRLSRGQLDEFQGQPWDILQSVWLQIQAPPSEWFPEIALPGASS